MLGLDNPIHILMVLVVVLMVFGAKRLPEMGRGLGEGFHGFTKAIKGEQPVETLTSAPVAMDSVPAAAPVAAEPVHTA